MIIASYNVNGIRAAMKKGFLKWADRARADIICLQEIRANCDQIDTDAIAEAGWNCEFFPAEKPGYAGTGILSRQKLEEVQFGTGMEYGDKEGRVISGKIGGVRIYSVYAPSGSSGGPRQEFKMEWLKTFQDFCLSEMTERRDSSLFFCGDFNICHQEIDIHNPKGLGSTSGFLPEEREWFSGWLDIGLIDTFRWLNPALTQYSWWSMRGRARARNLGWRIDYITALKGDGERIQRAWIDQSADCSDHCPTLLSLEA